MSNISLDWCLKSWKTTLLMHPCFTRCSMIDRWIKTGFISYYRKKKCYYENPWSISTSISSMGFAQVNFNVSYIKNLNLSIFIGTLVGSTRTFSFQCIFILLYILTRSEVTWNWKICNTSSLHIKKSKFKIFQSLNFEFQIIGIRVSRI